MKQALFAVLIEMRGDNEWTDCHRRSNGRYDPEERLEKLRSLFFKSDHALGQRPLRLTRQSDAPAFSRYRDNVRWEVGRCASLCNAAPPTGLGWRRRLPRREPRTARG